MIRDLNRKHECRVTHLSPEVLASLAAASWPGNVRELRNTVERAVIMAAEGEVRLQHVSGGLSGLRAPQQQPAVIPQAPREDLLQMPVGSQLKDVEQAYVQLTLKHTKNNKTRAAELLGLCLRTLHNKLRSYDSEAKGAAAGGGRVAD
jgi:DNA-binding NtrC family response regulator